MNKTKVIKMAIKSKPLNKEELRERFRTEMNSSQLEDMIKTIKDINELKIEKNAVILAHYYMRDGIKFGVADYVGDSLDLSKVAKEADADIIVFCGVNFMAETAKILNPGKKVLLPSLRAGCSLAESIKGEDVRRLRELHPDAAFVTYINTTADVKAECDVCVTSANAPRIISRLEEKEIYFLPDNYMARNIAEDLKDKTDKKITFWNGECIVHEGFTAGKIQSYRIGNPGLQVLAHYECKPEVINVADMHGGTSDMRRFIRENEAPAYLLVTECGLSSTVKAEFPDKNIIGPCNLCPYMKEVDLNNTRDALINEQPEITVPEDIRVRANKALERMFELGK
jgi:quinolinate synthase